MKIHMELKNKIKEFSSQAALLSRQAVEVSKTNRKQGLELMRQARDASKQCQLLIQQFQKLQVKD
jgi:t-SNARE complex subunit (syntaxin)